MLVVFNLCVPSPVDRIVGVKKEFSESKVYIVLSVSFSSQTLSSRYCAQHSPNATTSLLAYCSRSRKSRDFISKSPPPTAYIETSETRKAG
jgi:hypothetical protein